MASTLHPKPLISNYQYLLVIILLIILLNPVMSSSVTLTWHTFLGGSGSDGIDNVIVAPDGYIYVASYSNATWGTPLNAYTGGYDIVISKLDSNGNLIWHTFLGGSANDYPPGLAYSTYDNHLYIAGLSATSWGAPLVAHHGDYDGYVAKMDTNGNIIWHTFLGSADEDEARRVDIDPSNGDIVVCGDSDSTWGTPIQPFNGTLINVYVARLNNNGTLIWNTFVGESTSDKTSRGFKLDGNGNACVAGHGIGTWGTPIRPYSGSGYDVYTAQVNSSGFLVWNTFLGAPGIDASNDYNSGLAVDSVNNVYTSGTSRLTWGSPIEPIHGDRDAFVAKMASNGTLLWHTFIGGTGSDGVYRIRVDDSQNIYVVGAADASWGAPDRAYASAQDVYLAKLNNLGQYSWHMYLGGSGDDSSRGLAADGVGNFIIGGTSNATWGSPLRSYTGSTDAFIAKVDEFFISPTITVTYTGTPTLTHSPTVTITPTPSSTPITTSTPVVILNTATQTISPTSTKTVLPVQPLISNFIITPNPFVASHQHAIFQYILFEDANVTLTIYSYLGGVIKQINSSAGQMGAQGHGGGQTNQLTWDGRNHNGLLQASGGYICRITVEKNGKREEATQKVALIR